MQYDDADQSSQPIGHHSYKWDCSLPAQMLKNTHGSSRISTMESGEDRFIE